MKDEPRSHPFRDSIEDIAAAKRIPDTAQTRAPAYRLAFADRRLIVGMVTGGTRAPHSAAGEGAGANG